MTLGNAIFDPQTWLPGRARPVASRRQLPIYLEVEGSFYSFTEDGFERYLTDLLRAYETSGASGHPYPGTYGTPLKQKPQGITRCRNRDGYSKYFRGTGNCRFFRFDYDTDAMDLRSHLKYFRQMQDTGHYPDGVELEDAPFRERF